MSKETLEQDIRTGREKKDTVNCLECGKSVFCDDLVAIEIWDNTGLCLECTQRKDDIGDIFESIGNARDGHTPYEDDKEEY